MKIVRKFVWLLLTLGLLVLAVQTARPIALGLAACMVLLPLLCLPVNLYAAKKLKLAVGLPVNLRKGESGTAELTVQNSTVFPICQISCRVCLENQLNGETQIVHVSGGIWPKSKRSMKISLQSPWCGRVRLNVESARLYDCFGLIGVKTQLDAHGACVVQPDTFLQTLVLSPAAAHIDDTEDYSNECPGYDLSEMFQIRDYVPGDSQRQVHWKLSHKYGKLIVKDPSLPITRSAAVFWERTEENPTVDRTDAEAEIVVSVCRNLLSQSVQFTVGWNEGDTGRCVFQQIRDMDDLIGLLPRLFTAKAATGVSGASLLLQEVPAGSWSHLIYVSGEQQAETEQDFLDIRGEMSDAGYIRKQGKKVLQRPSKPREFKTSGGFRVLVGRNNRQNDKLTLKDADYRDLWFHVQKLHGSHVILCTNGGEPGDQDITEAAGLAAYYSQAKDSANVPVDCTQVKYVKKPVGARPGMVIYTTYRTVNVTPAEDLVRRLQNGK